jgi:hypothetical protein
MTDHTLSNNPYDGSISMTCKEAAQLLNKDLVTKAWFRPDGFITYDNPNDDHAFVWLKDGVKYEMQQTNNTNTI